LPAIDRAKSGGNPVNSSVSIPICSSAGLPKTSHRSSAGQENNLTKNPSW
jgi:hypothetical protein